MGYINILHYKNMTEYWTDEIPVNQDDSESELLENWEDDEVEIKAKKEAAKKAEADKQAERVRKLEERKAAEKAEKEEKLRILTQEELDEKLEAQEYADAENFLGIEEKSKPILKNEKDLNSFTPKCKAACDDYAKLFAARMFEMYEDKSVKKNFSYLAENCVKELMNGMPVENWEMVKNLGKSISAIGNGKQQDYNRKTKKKQKTSDKPGLKGVNKAADIFDGGEEEYDDGDGLMS